MPVSRVCLAGEGAPSGASEAGGAVSDDALFRDKLKHMGKCECVQGLCWQGWSGQGQWQQYLALSQTQSQPAFPTTN